MTRYVCPAHGDDAGCQQEGSLCGQWSRIEELADVIPTRPLGDRAHREVYEPIEAVLLNSECVPGVAVERALEAVCFFAYTECDITEERFIECVREKWKLGIAKALD